MSEVTVTELSEDIEVVGPGQMLSDARKKKDWSVEQVAKKLNFRICQVKDIEADNFDKTVPETFTRGYLLNYAKLVGISAADILASYESLGVAQKQGAEMQSFSKITEKEAQHSRIMWLSYLIITVLVTLSVVYYFQEAKNQQKSATPINSEKATQVDEIKKQDAGGESESNTSQLNVEVVEVTLATNDAVVNSTVAKLPQNNQAIAADLTTDNAIEQPSRPEITRAIFTFAGDCWVNIHDSTGERIAYGIKKAGYVMELNGKAPFDVVVGKPELVSITLNGNVVDMSKYNHGNIAKFTLPETPES